MVDEDRGAAAVELKQTAARAFGEEFAKLIDRVRSTEEEITIDEWYRLTAVWMQRAETLEVFMTVLAHCERYSTRVFPPGKSLVFKEMFIRYAAADVNAVLTGEFRDVLAWILFKIGSSGHHAGARRLPSLEDVFNE